MNPHPRPVPTALVTGGSKGIGRAVSLALAQSGADIALLLKHDRAAGERLVAEIRHTGRRAQAFYGDVGDRRQIKDLLDAVVARFGAIDMLVNNAGAAAAGALLSLDDDAWARVVTTNLTGCFVVGTEVAKIMRGQGGGAIVNIAGASAHRCYPGAGAFGPSKAAVVNLTRQMAIEWADYGIRVNGVSPGPIRPAGGDWQTLEPQLAAVAVRCMWMGN